MKTFFLLFAFVFTFISSVQAASPCTAEDDGYAKDNGNPSSEEAYEFGLSIQKLVKEKDLEGLFALVDGELKNGPRRKFVLSLSFDELFNEEWVKSVLDDKPSCRAVGWRGYMLGTGQIWYQEGDSKWWIFSINSDVQETAKPTPASWQVNKNILSAACFAYEWLSSDNFEEFAERFKIGKYGSKNYIDFNQNPGKYFGKEINSYEPISTGWDIPHDRISLIRFVRNCSIATQGLKIGDPSIVLATDDTNYQLLGSLPSKDCQNLAPSVDAECSESYLVGVSDGGGGSMGPTWRYGIYGLFSLGGFGKSVIPLKFFQTKNDALNYLDSIK